MSNAGESYVNPRTLTNGTVIHLTGKLAPEEVAKTLASLCGSETHHRLTQRIQRTLARWQQRKRNYGPERVQAFLETPFFQSNVEELRPSTMEKQGRTLLRLPFRRTTTTSLLLAMAKQIRSSKPNGVAPETLANVSSGPNGGLSLNDLLHRSLDPAEREKTMAFFKRKRNPYRCRSEKFVSDLAANLVLVDEPLRHLDELLEKSFRISELEQHHRLLCDDEKLEESTKNHLRTYDCLVQFWKGLYVQTLNLVMEWKGRSRADYDELDDEIEKTNDEKKTSKTQDYRHLTNASKPELNPVDLDLFQSNVTSYQPERLQRTGSESSTFLDAVNGYVVKEETDFLKVDVSSFDDYPVDPLEDPDPSSNESTIGEVDRSIDSSVSSRGRKLKRRFTDDQLRDDENSRDSGEEFTPSGPKPVVVKKRGRPRKYPEEVPHLGPPPGQIIFRPPGRPRGRPPRIPVFSDHRIREAELPNNPEEQPLSKPAPPLKCRLCGKIVIKNVQYHMIDHHGAEYAHLCPLCEDQSIDDMIFHLNTVHFHRKMYTCDQCPNSFITENRLNRHKVRHSSIYKFFCKDCSASFCSADFLERHTCQGKGAKNISSKKQSKPKVSEEDRCWICDLCGTVVTGKATLNRKIRQHKLRAHNPQQRAYTCKICRKSFVNSQTLKLHGLIHSDFKPFVCFHEGCGKKFKTSKNLSQHKHFHRGRRFCCPCGLKFFFRYQLTGHKSKCGIPSFDTNEPPIEYNLRLGDSLNYPLK